MFCRYPLHNTTNKAQSSTYTHILAIRILQHSYMKKHTSPVLGDNARGVREIGTIPGPRVSHVHSVERPANKPYFLHRIMCILAVSSRVDGGHMSGWARYMGSRPESIGQVYRTSQSVDISTLLFFNKRV